MPPVSGSHNAAPSPFSENLERLDRDVSRVIATRTPHPRWLTVPLSGLSLSANYGVLWYCVALLPLLLGEPRPLVKALYVAVPVTAAEATGYVVKRLIARPRPPVADPSQPRQIPLPRSKSFPSSHASMSVVGAFAVSAIYPSLLPALTALAVVLCCSRVYLGVHYLGDVLGGILYGLVFGALWVWLVPLGA